MDKDLRLILNEDLQLILEKYLRFIFDKDLRLILNKDLRLILNKDLRLILAVNGDPEMWLSANLTEMLYSPGAVGTYPTVQVPSPLSTHLISVLEGPSMARDSPPDQTQIVKS